MKQTLITVVAFLALLLSGQKSQAQVTISLSTSASELPMVLPGDEIDPTPDEPLTAAAKKKLAKKKRLRALVKDHFVTAVSLSNRSKNPIEFAYDSQEGAKCHFYITLSDQDGNVYWESPSPVEEVDNPVSALRTRLNADGEEEENYEEEQIICTLPAGKTWRSSVSVPLVIEDSPLYPGTYIITASAGSFSASAQFIVTPPAEESATGSMDGCVLLGERDKNGEPIAKAWTPGAGFYVQVSESWDDNAIHFREPFYWEGTTDENGMFKLTPPVGHYYISAEGPNGDDWVWGELEVDVADGVKTKAVIRILPELGPREPQEDTGVNGTVKFADGTAAAGWNVSVLETSLAEGSARPPFEEDTTTDEEGAFSINTPDGTYQVTAMRGYSWFDDYEGDCMFPFAGATVSRMAGGNYFPRPKFEIATGTVTVTAGRFSAIELKVSTNAGPLPPIVVEGTVKPSLR